MLIVGAFVEPVVSKLREDYPRLFVHCVPECVQIPETTLKQGLQNGIYVDYRKRDQLFEVSSVAAVKEIMDKVS